MEDTNKSNLAAIGLGILLLALLLAGRTWRLLILYGLAMGVLAMAPALLLALVGWLKEGRADSKSLGPPPPLYPPPEQYTAPP